MAKAIECDFCRVLDNGKDFAEHKQLAAAPRHVYFINPNCTWKTGTNEHTNGLPRQFLLNASDMTHLPFW